MGCRTFLPALLVLLNCAAAHGVILFLDVGDQTTGVRNGPVDHQNPRLVVLPGRSVSLHLWGIPSADDAKVVAALGHEIRIAGDGAGAVQATDYVIDNPLIQSESRWTGARLVDGLNLPGHLVSDQRLVFVPTAVPYVGGLGSEFLADDPARDAATGAIRLARLDLDIDSDAQAGQVAELRLAVGELLIASATTGTPADEPVFFGFDQDGAEPATGSGSVVGASSATADAVITITSFGDANADGEITLDDVASFFDCESGEGVATSEINCGLFDSDADGDVDFVDFGALQLIITAEGER